MSANQPPSESSRKDNKVKYLEAMHLYKTIVDPQTHQIYTNIPPAVAEATLKKVYNDILSLDIDVCPEAMLGRCILNAYGHGTSQDLMLAREWLIHSS